jgi:hypothetical protein
MKKILLPLFFLFFLGCSKDENNDPFAGLPPETQTGANTFGCLIDGKLFLPRNGNNSMVFPLSGVNLWGGYPNSLDYFEIEVIDYKSIETNSLLLHLHDIANTGIGEFTINESNGEDNIDGLDHFYLHCTLYDKNTNTYQKYVSFENSGKVKINKIYISNVNGIGNIVSGTFYCKLRNINNTSDTREITNGRFDINSLTIAYKVFP